MFVNVPVDDVSVNTYVDERDGVRVARTTHPPYARRVIHQRRRLDLVLSVAALASFGVLAACGGGESSSAADTDSGTVAIDDMMPGVNVDAPATTESTIATTTTEPGPPRITFAFTGDILIHSQVWTAAQQNTGGVGYDFAPMFADIQPLVSSVDLGICHLEVPIAPPGKEPSTFPLYGAPVELVAGIKSGGYDRCSTASNHTLDQGVKGIEATIAAFEANGLTQAGMARTPDEIEPKVIDVEDFKVTHLSYTWGYNGLETPSGESWRSARNNPERIIADAKKAREMGAQIVIVSMHWGVEPSAQITSTQRQQAEQITASGQVNLIVGHHSHVLQPIEQVNGVWTVFGLGNILSAHPTRSFFTDASQDGMVVTVDMTIDEVTGAITVEQPVAHPTWVDKDNGYVIRDVLAQLARTDLSAGQRSIYEQSLARTQKQVAAFIVAA